MNIYLQSYIDVRNSYNAISEFCKSPISVSLTCKDFILNIECGFIFYGKYHNSLESVNQDKLIRLLGNEGHNSMG